jgi:hypothetical protein
LDTKSPKYLEMAQGHISLSNASMARMSASVATKTRTTTGSVDSLDLGLHVFDGVRGLHLQCDRLPRQDLHEGMYLGRRVLFQWRPP